MREHTAKIVIVGLMLLVVGVPFALRPRGAAGVAGVSETPTDYVGRLVVYTPHNEQIRLEMGAGFNRWRAAEGLGPIDFDWRASGGTSDLRRTILAQFESKARQGRLDEGIGADLFFGGGEFDHDRIAGGVRVTVDGEDIEEPVAVVPRLPEGLLREALPNDTIGGERLVHEDGRWVGTALSSFGIVYNRDLLVMLDRPEPESWRDLTHPAYRGWVALADPGHSGSISAAFNTVLRRQGWTEGWATLRRVFANARYFASAASKVPVDVSSGEAAAGMCIDFYGRTQAGAVAAAGWSGDTAGVGISRLGYVDPVVGGKSMTATTADPITLLRGAPNREVAEQFVAWVLSKDAQRLWQTKLGTPLDEGGPLRFELRRQPIRADLFVAEEKATWTDPEIDPYPTAVPILDGVPDFFSMVRAVTPAMGIHTHKDLTAAWAAIQRTPDDHPDRPEMLRLFDAMPETLTLTWPSAELDDGGWRDALSDPGHPLHETAAETLAAFMDRLGSRSDDQELKDQLAWTLFFRDNYRQIAAMGAR
ncbi:MAG: extracellular solute-binding protein [Planctomycetota bacterium]